MKLLFNQPHMSIDKSDQPVEVSDFTILTGLNGSGKTHLLQAIQQRKVLIEGMDEPVIASFGPTDLVKNNEQATGTATLKTRIDACWNRFQSIRGGLKGNVENIRRSIERHHAANKTQAGGRPDSYFLEYSSLMYIFDEMGEKILDATLADFRQFYPIFVEANRAPSPILNGISDIFWLYHSKMDDNAYDHYLNQKDGGSRPIMSEEKFRAVNGREPWKVLNDLLENHFKIPYRVNSPQDPAGKGDARPLTRDDTYNFQLLHVEKNVSSMNFSSLSSGEKMMMALVASMYKSSFKASKFPNVLLLDEVDAVLHPSMIQQALGVIQNYFVNDQGMKVLMATHSPSTVAYAPEESIYIVNPSGKEPRVEKQDKQTALSILTEGVVSCFFDPNARLQIRHSIRTKRKPILLVEGFTDALIIQKAWEKIRGSEIPFDIKDCFGAGLLRATLQNANDIVGKGEGAKVFGLFDYDAAGFGNWAALKSSKWTDISTKEIQAKKNPEHEWHALLLPVPKHLVAQAGKNHGIESRIEIEHLLSGHPKGEKFFVEKEAIGGGKIVAFQGDKQKFAEQAILDFPREAFGDFDPLFRFIEEQINPPDNVDG